MPKRHRIARLRLLWAIGILLMAGCSPAGPADRAPDDTARRDASGADLGDEPAVVAGPDVPPLLASVDGLDEVVITFHEADGVRIDAKVAATDAARGRGLMEVPALPDGVGMLFTFSAERRGGFWMKNTLIPLDIAFADADGTLLRILTMEPCTSDPCPVHDPGVKYRSALEVPAGWFAANGVREGDRMMLGPVTPDEVAR